MQSTPLNLFNPFITCPFLDKKQSFAQEIVFYGESRIRSILIAYNQADIGKKTWMTSYIDQELELILRYIGMATTTGYPIEIPILIRSLAACMAGPAPRGYLPLAFDFKLIEALDAGTSQGDPSALVETYAHAWWLMDTAPDAKEVLSTSTLDECLQWDRKYRKHSVAVPTFEKPAYTWGRGLWGDEAEGQGCDNCRPMRGLLTAACDELRQLRLMIDALETHFDSERQLSNRRAGGAHSLFTSSELKATEAGEFPVDAETGIGQRIPSATPALVPGTIRQPRKGPGVAGRVRKAAAKDLLDFQSRPNMKWTWGIDLGYKDLQDLMGSRYNARLEESHSGYDTDLPDGTVTGSDSVAPGAMDPNSRFDKLSEDIIDPPNLSPSHIPNIFQHHPLGAIGVHSSVPGKMMQKRLKDQRHQAGKSKVKMPRLVRDNSPDLTISEFVVPAPSIEAQTSDPATGAQFQDADSRMPVTYKSAHRPAIIATLPGRLAKSNHTSDRNITPSALKPVNIDDITLPAVAECVPVYWQTPVSVGTSVKPPTSGMSDKFRNLPSSPTTEYVHRHRWVNIFSDEEMDVDGHDAGQPALLTIDVETMAEAWSSSDEEESQPIFNLTQPTPPVNADLIAETWASSPSVLVYGVDLDQLAAAVSSDHEVPVHAESTPGEYLSSEGMVTSGREMVPSESHSEASGHHVDVDRLAAAWDSSEEDLEVDASKNPPLSYRQSQIVPVSNVDVGQLAEIWDNSSDVSSLSHSQRPVANEPFFAASPRHPSLPTLPSQPAVTLAAKVDGSVTGLYTTQSFANIPDDWMSGI